MNKKKQIKTYNNCNFGLIKIKKKENLTVHFFPIFRTL